jgi:hypothetical protein
VNARLDQRVHRFVGFLENVLQRVAALSQCRFEIVIIGLRDFVQQVLVVFLQDFQQQLVFLVGQPQFHGDLHECCECK